MRTECALNPLTCEPNDIKDYVKEQLHVVKPINPDDTTSFDDFHAISITSIFCLFDLIYHELPLKHTRSIQVLHEAMPDVI